LSIKFAIDFSCAFFLEIEFGGLRVHKLGITRRQFGYNSITPEDLLRFHSCCLLYIDDDGMYIKDQLNHP
jgi:hypothetical protein